MALPYRIYLKAKRIPIRMTAAAIRIVLHSPRFSPEGPIRRISCALPQVTAQAASGQTSRIRCHGAPYTNRLAASSSGHWRRLGST